MLSVVVPVYGCAHVLERLYSELHSVLDTFVEDFELILVDDASDDKAWPLITKLAKSTGHVRGIRLSRNFGQHAAIMAGLRASLGSVCVVMDCDLQDPIDKIPEMIAMLSDEHNVVVACRDLRSESRSRRLQSRIYEKVMKIVSGQTIDSSATNFSALSRKVVNEYIRFSEKNHHFLYVISWLGFEPRKLAIARNTSARGGSSYSLKRRVKHAASGLFFYSSRVMVGLAIAGITIALTGIMITCLLFVLSQFSRFESGWLSIVSLILVASGINIAVVSVVGIYVNQVFDYAKRRPLFIVRDLI